MKIIQQIGLLAPVIHVSFTLEEKAGRDRELFALSAQAYQQLHDFAQAQQIQESRILVKGQDIKTVSPELAHLSTELYAYPVKPWRGPVHHIHCLAAGSPYAEIEYAAGRIHTLVYERGWRWRDITVLSSDWERYRLLFRQVFELYGIPHFFDIKRSLMHHPLTRLVLAVLNIVTKGYRQDDMMQMLKSGLTPLERDEAEQLENYVLRFGIKGWGWKRPFTKGEENQCAEMERLRNLLLEPLQRLEKQLAAAGHSRTITEALYQFLVDLQVQEKIEIDLNRFFQESQFEWLAESSQVWNAFIEIWEQMGEFIADAPLNLAEYQSILETGLQAHRLGIIPPTLDQVVVGDLERTINEGCKALFIVGVNDGLIPQAGSDEGLFSSAEREWLHEEGISLPSRTAYQDAREDLLLYAAFTKPHQGLYVSYAAADSEGRALRPSLMIRRLKQIFPHLEVENDLDKRLPVPWSSPGGSFNHLLRHLRAFQDGLEVDDLWHGIYNWFKERPEWSVPITLAEQGLNYRNQQEFLALPPDQLHASQPQILSVSRLELYAACPFSHYVHYGLRPEPRREYGVTAPDVGDFFHRGLYAFFQKVYGGPKADWDQEQIQELAGQVWDELIPAYGEAVFSSSERYRYLGQRLKRIGCRAMTTLWQQLARGDFKPLALEAKFGWGGLLPPLKVELETGSHLYIEGRIDRIDCWDGEEDSYVTVVDYKTGGKVLDLNEVYHGLNLQLFLYMKAVLAGAEALQRHRLHPAGIFYFHVDDPLVESPDLLVSHIEKELAQRLRLKGLVLADINIIRKMDRDFTDTSPVIPVSLKKDETIGGTSAVLNETEIYQFMQHVDGMLKTMGLEIRQGKIKLAPLQLKNFQACNYCSYRSVCQFDTTMPGNDFRYRRAYSPKQIKERILQQRRPTSD